MFWLCSRLRESLISRRGQAARRPYFVSSRRLPRTRPFSQLFDRFRSYLIIGSAVLQLGQFLRASDTGIYAAAVCAALPPRAPLALALEERARAAAGDHGRSRRACCGRASL